MAPNAASGATFTMMCMIPKNTFSPTASAWSTGFPFSPMNETAKAVRMATRRTCRISPLAKASKKDFGMIFRMKSVVLCALPFSANPFPTAGSTGRRFLGNSAPGCQTLTTTSPMISANVETISK
jgi:hypothetical protein